MFLWKVLSSITMLEFLPVKTPALDITLLSSNTQFTIFIIAHPKQATPPPSVVPIALLERECTINHGHINVVESIHT